MPTWPASLPAPAINTLREKPPRNAIRTGMDKGPDKVRRRTTANIRPLSFTLKLTPAQLQTLDDFFVENEAEEFTYTHPRTAETVTARFVEEPDYSELEGVLYNVGVSLEILP